MSDKPAVFEADYVDIRQVKSRKVYQIVLEIPKEAANAFAAAFGMPESDKQIPVAIARLETQRALEPPPPEGMVRTFNPCGQANVRCKTPEFWRFLTFLTGSGCEDEVRAAYIVREHCGVTSRSELNRNEEAAARWLALNDQYYGWQRDMRAQT